MEGDNFACLGGGGGKSKTGPGECPPRKPSSNISASTGTVSSEVCDQLSRHHRWVTMTSLACPGPGGNEDIGLTQRLGCPEDMSQLHSRPGTSSSNHLPFACILLTPRCERPADPLWRTNEGRKASYSVRKGCGRHSKFDEEEGPKEPNL